MCADREWWQSRQLHSEPLRTQSRPCLCSDNESRKRHAGRGALSQGPGAGKIMRTAIKVAIAAAALAASFVFAAPAGHASNDAPWCAVINLGMGDARWDCRYRTVEECVPNVIGGDRGSCSPNPYDRGSAAVAVPRKRHYKRHVEHD